MASSFDTNPRQRDDGFDRIPADAHRVFLLQANPAIHHLPTELAARKRDLWWVEKSLRNVQRGAIAILWQAGAKAGIYAIAVVEHEEEYRVEDIPHRMSHLPTVFNKPKHKQIGLHYVYVLGKPILRNELGRFAVLRQNLALRSSFQGTACAITKDEWACIYELLKQNRNGTRYGARQRRVGIITPLELRDSVEVSFPPETGPDDLDALPCELWSMLTELATANRRASANGRITAQQLAKDLNVSLHRLEHSLNLIEAICNGERWPSLPILVHSDYPTTLEICTSAEPTRIQPLSASDAAAMDWVNRVDWSQKPHPFEFFLQGQTADQLVDTLISDPSANSSSVYRLAKVRGVAQRIFARMLRRIYGNRCAFCRLSYPPALEAAHIKPWIEAKPSERLLPSNGLLLCATHHRLFDVGLLTLDDENWIEIIDHESVPIIGKADQHLLDLHTQAALLPDDPEHRPAKRFLDYRKKYIERMRG